MVNGPKCKGVGEFASSPSRWEGSCSKRNNMKQHKGVAYFCSTMYYTMSTKDAPINSALAQLVCKHFWRSQPAGSKHMGRILPDVREISLLRFVGFQGKYPCPSAFPIGNLQKLSGTRASVTPSPTRCDLRKNSSGRPSLRSFWFTARGLPHKRTCRTINSTQCKATWPRRLTCAGRARKVA